MYSEKDQIRAASENRTPSRRCWQQRMQVMVDDELERQRRDHWSLIEAMHSRQTHSQKLQTRDLVRLRWDFAIENSILYQYHCNMGG